MSPYGIRKIKQSPRPVKVSKPRPSNGLKKSQAMLSTRQATVPPTTNAKIATQRARAIESSEPTRGIHESSVMIGENSR